MQVRVPGKVMLSGEYTVLIGGTAVLVPVPCYMTLTTVDSPDPTADTPVIHEALTEPIPELADKEKDLSAIYVSVDRSEFMTTDSNGVTNKLGLGGSAAEAVGVIALRFKQCGVDWKTIPETIFKYADSAHRRAQGGMGSGADVAAIAYRRPIRFKRVKNVPEIEVIETPQPEFIPKLALAWTGISANTRDFVPKFLTWAADTENEISMHMIEMISGALSERWFTERWRGFFGILDSHTFLLAGSLQSAEIEWMLPVHQELWKWATNHHGWAKPTGAGGGDMALLIGDLPYEERPELIIPLDPFAEI